MTNQECFDYFCSVCPQTSAHLVPQVATVFGVKLPTLQEAVKELATTKEIDVKRMAILRLAISKADMSCVDWERDWNSSDMNC